ncbi:apolipoprotein B receptor isoform X2 [Dromiciops gliroides]|nr:apolipoprotein B receptor isoform X2 [Dromiciops gliroides]
MPAEGSQQAGESKEALEGDEVISSRDVEDNVSSRGSESREAWEKGKEKKAREIQESETEGIWQIGKEVGGRLNEEMTRVCRTWDNNDRNSKEAKGEIRGNYKIEVQGVQCMMGTESKQGQKTDALEARECQKDGILVEGYLETEEFASEEKGGREPKAQGHKNQESNEKEINVGKAENYWKRNEIEPVGEQKVEVEERDLHGIIALGVESENGIIWKKEKEDRQAQETEGNVRDWQEARGEKTWRVKKGDPGNGLNTEMGTRKKPETKKVPDVAVGRGLEEDGEIETPENQQVEKHEVKGAWEAEKIGIRSEKKKMEKEVAWEVRGIKPVDIDLEKLQGVQELGEETEREDKVKSELWRTSVMEKAEAREAVKSKTAEINPKKEAEEVWKAENLEIRREWNMEVIQRDWGAEEAAGKDLERTKDEEREPKENPFPEQVWSQRTEREEEMANIWVLGKKEIVKVLESEMEVEGSWSLEGEAGESGESQSGQNGAQDIQETKVWEKTPDNVNRNKEIELGEAKEVMGGWELEPTRPQEAEETERIDDSDETSVTRLDKEVEGAELMREAEVGKSQELETKDKVSYGTEEVREDQNPKEVGENWNMETEIGRAQETEKEPRKAQDLMEEEAKGREEEPFRIPERETLEIYEIEAYSALNIKNTENGDVQKVKKQDLVVAEGWKIMEREIEGEAMTEIEDKGGCEGEEDIFTPQYREDEEDWEAKESQEFKQQEVPQAEIKTVWRTKEAGTTEPEMEEKEVRGVWEKELEEDQEAQVDRGHKMEESEARKLQEREVIGAKIYWEAEGEVIRSQMKEVEGSQEREDTSIRTLDREAEEVLEGNAEIVNQKVGLKLKEDESGRSQKTEQVKSDRKEIRRDWDSEEAISQERTETRESPGSNLLEARVREALEKENKGFWEAEGTEECQATEGMTGRDQVVEESEAGRSWEREEKESEGDQETGSADAKESWIVEKEEAGNNCEKEKSVFSQGSEIQMAITNKEVEPVREEEMKEGRIKSEKKHEEGRENRETEKGVDGDQGVDSESTWPLEEETQYEEADEAEAKTGESHAVEGECSMDNRYMEKIEANGGRRLEVEKMEGRNNIEESGSQGGGNREKLEPAGCCDMEKEVGWGDGGKDSEAVGVWEPNEKTGRAWDLEKAEPGQGRGPEEAAHIDSGTLEASGNREAEATAPLDSVAIRLSPAPSPAEEAQISWNEAPIPGPCLDLSIPKSRVLLSRNASQRRSRPSFRRSPAPKKSYSDDYNEEEASLSLPHNEGSPASKRRLLQSQETTVPSPPKPEGTPTTARKRPPGHGFGLAHPSMMQELQARLGRSKPQ